MAFTRKNLLNY